MLHATQIQQQAQTKLDTLRREARAARAAREVSAPRFGVALRVLGERLFVRPSAAVPADTLRRA